MNKNRKNVVMRLGVLSLISILFLFTILCVKVFALSTLTPPYILNLYNASYITQNVTNQYITNGTTPGTCPTGYVVQNTTTSGVDCIIATAGSGTVTQVTSGYGLNYSVITNSGTINVNDSVIQNRVSQTCAAGSSIRVINQDGTVTCENDSTGSGTVTSVATGFGLLGGTITDSGTLYVNMVDIGGNIGNYSQYASIIYANITGLQQSNTSTNQRITDLNSSLSNYVNKTTRINVTGPLFINGGANALIQNGFELTITQSNSVTGGFLTATDWNTFNNKANYSTVIDINSNVTQLQTNVASLVVNTTNGINNLNDTKAVVLNVTCSTGYGVQNLSLGADSSSAQCVPLSVGGGGTVTSVDTGFGLYGGPITVSGTLFVNMTDIGSNIGNWSADKSLYSTLNYVNAINNVSYAYVNAINNVSYAYVNAINNVSLSTIQGLIDANGNWTLDKPYYAFYPNISQIQTNLASLITNMSQQNGYANITQLQTSMGTLVTNVSQQNGYANITQLQTNLASLVTNVSQQNAYTNVTQLQTSMGTVVTNLTNNVNNLNTSKANLAGAIFTGNVQIPQLNITSNVTISGVTSTLVCVLGDNNGCYIRANSTCRQYLSPDGLTAVKVANSGTVC